MNIHPKLACVSKFINSTKDHTSEAIGKVYTTTGKWIYDLGIPVYSDYVGGFTGTYDKNQPLSLSIKAGIFVGGGAKHLGGMGEGVVEAVALPCRTLEALNNVILYPAEVGEALYKNAKDYVNKEIINGTTEERLEAAGAMTAEVATWLVAFTKVGKASQVSKIEVIEAGQSTLK